jgi:hypothetical protein
MQDDPMKIPTLALGSCALLLATACTGPMVRGDCEFMRSNERASCLAANESSRQIAAAHQKEQRIAARSRGQFDQGSLDAARDEP